MRVASFGMPAAFESLDRQLDALPKDVRFCRNCVVSNQRPRTRINDDGVCSACQWSFEKDHVVDWTARGRELEALCDRYRSCDGSFDVVVPGSGGKDSAFVAHQLKHRWGMHPLCVTWAPFEYTPIGWLNLQNFVNSGFNNLLGQPDGLIHRKLSRLAFELKGDAWEPFGYGQKSWAFHIAHRFGIGLIFFGENGELEYGGREDFKEMPKQDPDDWVVEQFKGATVDELVRVGQERGMLTDSEGRDALRWYKAPPAEAIITLGVEAHWYSYYRKWIPQENFYYAMRHTGFDCNDDGRSEGTYTKYVSLDDKADGFHWYLSYMKFGMARASRDAQQDIRRHHITRAEGVRLTRRYDGEFPQKYYQWFLQYLDITDEQFWSVMDYYRERSNVWQRINGVWTLMHVVE